MLPHPEKLPAVEPQGRGFSSSAAKGSLRGGSLSAEGSLTVRQRFCAMLRVRERSECDRRSIRELCAKAWGAFFLRRAQWQLSRTSVLGGLLRKHISDPLPPSFDAFCDVLPCLDLLGVSGPGLAEGFGRGGPSQIGRLANHALWPLNGFEQPSGDLEISRSNSIIGAISPSVRFFLEYEKEKRQVFMEASRFEFYLENGSRIITDVCLTGLGDEAGFSACAEQAMTMLSHCVISNNRPAIFLSSGGFAEGGGGFGHDGRVRRRGR